MCDVGTSFDHRLQHHRLFLNSDLMERTGCGCELHGKSYPIAEPLYQLRATRYKNATFPDINGEKPEVPTFLCGRAIQKLLPQFDSIYPQIAKTAGDCRFWFVGIDAPNAMEIFNNRLAAAFSDLGLRSEDYCTIYPPLQSHDLSGLLAASDVVLDPILWSGADKRWKPSRMVGRSLPCLGPPCEAAIPTQCLKGWNSRIDCRGCR